MTQKKEVLLWSACALWLLSIYASIPFARGFQYSMSARWGREVFIYISLAFTVAMAFSGIAFLLKSARRSVTAHLWLIAVAAAYAYWTFTLRSNPEVSLHFIQYGILTGLVFLALSQRIKDPLVYVLSLLIITLAATGDQIVKWFTPRRYFDYADIRLNAGAGLLMLIGIAKGLRPKGIERPVKNSSKRLLSLLSCALLILISLCLSNTPQVTKWLAGRFPYFSYLKFKDNLMAEYGFRFEDPEIGVFYSRFTLADLRRIDAERAKEAGRAIAAYMGVDKYHAFLAVYSPVTDPFLHEMRVHLFRREQYLAQALKDQNNDLNSFRYHSTVAFRENQLLEKYFTKTLNEARARLPDGQIKIIATGANRDEKYVSAVSSSLITAFNRAHVWLLTLVAVPALLLIQKRYS